MSATDKLAVKENAWGSEVYELRKSFNLLIAAIGLSGLNGALFNGVLQIATLAESATDAQFKTTTTLFWKRLGIQFTKAATDNLTFSAADTINVGTAAGLYWGGWLIEIDDAGAIATKPSGGLSDQVYATQAAAIAALPAVTAGKTAIGYLTVQCKTGASWTANTDDLTDDAETFAFVDASVIDFAAYRVNP